MTPETGVLGEKREPLDLHRSLWIRLAGRGSLRAMAPATPVESPSEFSRPLPIIGVWRVTVQCGAHDDVRLASMSLRPIRASPAGWLESFRGGRRGGFVDSQVKMLIVQRVRSPALVDGCGLGGTSLPRRPPA